MTTTKNITLVVIICLLFGGLLGWWARGGGEVHPAGEHTHLAADGVEYTCSMHPQIRQNEPGQCPICGMALTPVTNNTNGDPNPYVMEMTPEAIALANVQTSLVKAGSGEGTRTLTGKIEIDEQQVKRLTANFAGRIDELFVNFTGQEVHQGQKLATLYSPDLVNAQKELLETAKIKESQPALYQAAKEKLRLWSIGDRQIAAIEQSGETNTQFDIYADISGVVIARNVAVGDFVSRGSVLFEIVDLNRVWVMLDAYESDLAMLNRGNEVSFQVAAYPGEEFNATIAYIDPILNADTRTVGVRAEAVNRKNRLKPGMFVSAEITGSTLATPEVMVPKSAVLWTGPRSVVYVQVDSPNAPAYEMREIVLGNGVGDDYIVISGLEAGEKVVSNGVFAIDAAAQLRGNYSMMNRPEAKTVDVPESFRSQLTAFAGDYLTIKDALVKSDADATKAAILPAQSSLSLLEKEVLEGNAQTEWKRLSDLLNQSLRGMAEARDLATQRTQFELLSDGLIEVIERFGATENQLFKLYCPMAARDEGAFWLSREKEVRNPYFGDQMLTCGEVQQAYPAR
nr:efflux RND transporter periplasmic adaptor subunit [Cytophagales bacterium]